MTAHHGTECQINESFWVYLQQQARNQKNCRHGDPLLQAVVVALKVVQNLQRVHIKGR